MMIANKEEAFQHNSCKKIAQLSKVIFAMQSLKQDRRDEKKIIHKEFDQVVADFLEEHQSCLNSIFRSLCKFRKMCIANSCSEYGIEYKAVKKDFVRFVNEKSASLAEVMSEVKKIQADIQSFQSSSLQSAANFMEYSDILMKDLNVRQKQPLSACEIQKSLLPVNEKMLNYQNQWKEYVISEKQKQEEKKINLRSSYKKEIKQLDHGLFQFCKNLSSKGCLIKSEILTLKSNYKSILESHSVFTKMYFKNRNSIIAETNKTLREMEKQKKMILNRLNSKSSNVSYYANQLEIERSNSANLFKQKYDALKKEAHQQKHSRHQLQRSMLSLDDKRRADLIDKNNVQTHQYLNEQDKLLESQSYARKYIVLGLKDSEKLTSLLNQYITNSLNREKANILQMRDKIGRKEIAQQSASENLKALYTNLLDKENEILQNGLNRILHSSDLSRETDIVVELQKEYDNQKTDQGIKIESEISKCEKEVEAYAESCNQRILSRKEDNNMILIRKAEIKKRTLEQVKSKQQSELLCVVEKVNKENRMKYEEYKDTLGFPFAIPEIADHELDISKYKARLQFWDQSIDQAHLIAEKKVETLDQQISSLEKQTRQYQRMIKSQTQSIDEEYEMKITVLQVALNNKIENLAKIFNKEENQRGRDIIEAIRKVKEAENRRLNLMLRKNRESENMMSEINKKINQNKSKIKDIQDEICENELKQKIEDKKKSIELMIKAENQKRLEEISKVRENIENTNAENIMKLQMIEDEIKAEEQEFEENLQSINQEEKIIRDKAEDEKQEKTNLIEQQKIQMESQHIREVESYKKRIEYAKKVQQEEIITYEKEKKQTVSKLAEELKMRKQNNENKQSIEQFSQIDLNIKKEMDLYSSVSQLYTFNLGESDETVNKRSELERKAVQKTNNLSNEFLKHFYNIKNCPIVEKNVELPKRPNTTRRTSVSSQTKESLTRHNKVFIDNSNIKRCPSLVTPHLVA